MNRRFNAFDPDVRNTYPEDQPGFGSKMPSYSTKPGFGRSEAQGNFHSKYDEKSQMYYVSHGYNGSNGLNGRNNERDNYLEGNRRNEQNYNETSNGLNGKIGFNGRHDERDNNHHGNRDNDNYKPGKVQQPKSSQGESDAMKRYMHTENNHMSWQIRKCEERSYDPFDMSTESIEDSPEDPNFQNRCSTFSSSLFSYSGASNKNNGKNKEYQGSNETRRNKESSHSHSLTRSDVRKKEVDLEELDGFEMVHKSELGDDWELV